MLSHKLSLLALPASLLATVTSANPVIIDSALSSSYHYVDSYEIAIDAPAEVVWPHLLDFASWLGMIHEAGPRNAEGEILRLYEGQEYFVEIEKIIPNKLVLVVNLPSTMQGEDMVGIGMLTLTETDGKTVVSTFMARHYDWVQQTPNPLRATRGSAAFQEKTRIMWEDESLARLRELAESE